MREMPKDAHDFGWVDFEIWADAEGVTDIEGDWEAWWGCWRSGYECCNEMRDTEDLERQERESILEDP